MHQPEPSRAEPSAGRGVNGPIVLSTQPCATRPSVAEQFDPGFFLVQRGHLFSRTPHQDCLSNGSNGRTRQDLALQYHQLRKQGQAVQVSCHFHPPPWLWNMDLACWLWKKDPCFRNQVHEETSSYLLLGDWVWKKINFLLGPQEPLLATVMWQKRAWFCMSHATTASPKPSFRAPGRVDDAVVSRGTAGWTTSESGHICLCQNRSQGPVAGKTGRGSLLNHPSCPPDDPSSQGTELNWTKPQI